MKVDEEGTVAAGVSGMLLTSTPSRRPEPPFQMRVDHPFLCLIRERLTGALFFVAVILNPSS
jgi:serine protease inhibitor